MCLDTTAENAGKSPGKFPSGLAATVVAAVCSSSQWFGPCFVRSHLRAVAPTGMRHRRGLVRSDRCNVGRRRTGRGPRWVSPRGVDRACLAHPDAIAGSALRRWAAVTSGPASRHARERQAARRRNARPRERLAARPGERARGAADVRRARGQRFGRWAVRRAPAILCGEWSGHRSERESNENRRADRTANEHEMSGGVG